VVEEDNESIIAAKMKVLQRKTAAAAHQAAPVGNS